MYYSHSEFCASERLFCTQFWLFHPNPHRALQHKPTSAPAPAPESPFASSPPALRVVKLGEEDNGQLRGRGPWQERPGEQEHDFLISRHCWRLIYGLPRVASAAFPSANRERGQGLMFPRLEHSGERKRKASGFVGPQSHLLHRVALGHPAPAYIPAVPVILRRHGGRGSNRLKTPRAAQSLQPP